MVCVFVCVGGTLSPLCVAHVYKLTTNKLMFVINAPDSI